MVKKYIKNMLISIDQLINTMAGGDPDETISSRAGKRVDNCKLCAALCFVLNKINRNHCKNSIESDEGVNAVL